MKIAEHMAAQGDVLFRRIDALPADARREACVGPIVVAHSETGHHHVIESKDVEFFRGKDPMVTYLRLDGVFADVEHHRDYDTHETIRLLGRGDGPTFFEVRRQREHAPTGWQWISD